MRIVWILLEARLLNSFKNFLSKPYKYVFLYILDDKILGSWCLNV